MELVTVLIASFCFVQLASAQFPGLPTLIPARTTTRATTTTSQQGVSSTTQIPRNQSQDTCVCGVNRYNRYGDNKIIGGSAVREGEYPWRVALYEVSSTYPEGKFFCGATLISPQVILTAAHCTQDYAKNNSNKFVYVLAGYTDRKDVPFEKLIKVSKILIHANYGGTVGKQNDNDISLLFMDRPYNWTDAISPACLPFKFRDSEFENVTSYASGWGATKQRYLPGGGAMVDYMQHVLTKIIPTKKCQYEYYGIPKTNLSVVSDNQICADERGKGTCQGDSGGGLEIKDPTNRQFHTIGVVSWGVGCAEAYLPGVYSLVTKYLDWIIENSDREAPDQFFCGQPPRGQNSTTTTPRSTTRRRGLF